MLIGFSLVIKEVETIPAIIGNNVIINIVLNECF